MGILRIFKNKIIDGSRNDPSDHKVNARVCIDYVTGKVLPENALNSLIAKKAEQVGPLTVRLDNSYYLVRIMSITDESVIYKI